MSDLLIYDTPYGGLIRQGHDWTPNQYMGSVEPLGTVRYSLNGRPIGRESSFFENL